MCLQYTSAYHLLFILKFKLFQLDLHSRVQVQAGEPERSKRSKAYRVGKACCSGHIFFADLFFCRTAVKIIKNAINLMM